MKDFDVKEVMEQIHISEEMQEEIIMNVRHQMENKNRNWKKRAVSAAAAVLLIAGISIPVRAVVNNLARERMEALSEEEIAHALDVVQDCNAEADSFSRKYSDDEMAGMKQLRKEYDNGRFPENALPLADEEEKIAEGTLYYVVATGYFSLPDRELTDEELLEIIDFNCLRSYAVEKSPAAQEARKAYLEEKERLRAIVREAGGISEEEAIEIARKQMESEIGEKKDDMELMTDQYGQGAFLLDISDVTAYQHEQSVAYSVAFDNEDDHSIYACIIDAVDGSILSIQK